MKDVIDEYYRQHNKPKGVKKIKQEESTELEIKRGDKRRLFKPPFSF